jgi:hypothetical protein
MPSKAEWTYPLTVGYLNAPLSFLLPFHDAYISMSFFGMLQESVKWDPAEACRPIIDEAPVFHPTIEVFSCQQILLCHFGTYFFFSIF